MISVRDENVVDRRMTLNHPPRLVGHRRGINQDLMLTDRQQQAVEIKLLLVRKPRPLPDTGQDLFHGNKQRLIERNSLHDTGITEPRERL